MGSSCGWIDLCQSYASSTTVLATREYILAIELIVGELGGLGKSCSGYIQWEDELLPFGGRGVLNLLITIRVVIAKSSWSKLPLHAANLYGTAQAQGGRAGIGIKALEETVAYAPHTLIELASQFQ